MRFHPRGRWKWLLIVPIPIVTFLIAGNSLNTSPPTNIAQTAPDEAPELRTRFYARSVDEVFRAAQQVAGAQKTWLRSWRVTKADGHTINVEVPVIFFTDDLTIRVDESDGKTRVNVASKSRVGRGDFGENRRHITQFLRALDQEIGG